MAFSNKQTVFGFGTDLDWRPTHFVNPFPWHRVCSACGLIPSTVAILPCCSCILCLLCYNRDAYDNNRCPLDGELFQKKDVLWSTFTKDTVLKSRVRCWNAENGCNAEGVASSMLKHFTNECNYHAVSCPSCRGKFLHQDVANHVEYVCTGRFPLERKPTRRPRANESSDVMAALKKISDENVLLKKQLEALESRIICDRDNARKVLSSAVDEVTEGTSPTGLRRSESGYWCEISSQISHVLAENERNTRAFITRECNRIVQALTAERREADSSMNDAVMRTSRSALLSDLSDSMEKCLKYLGDEETLTKQNATRIVSMIAIACLAGANGALNITAPRELTIDGWKEWCAEEACSSGDRTTRLDSPSGYTYGYKTSFVVSVHPSCEELSIVANVHSGLYDHLLKWPPSITPKVRVIHPTRCTEDIILEEPITWKDVISSSNERNFEGSIQSISIMKLHSDGFGTSNRLRLEFDFVRL